MTARRKFEIVKRKVESNFGNTGLSLYLLGYVMHGGRDRLLVRAENEDGAVIDVYFSGREEYHDIQIKNPEAYRRISKRHVNVAKRLLKKCNREEDSLTDIAMDMDEDFAEAVAIAEDVKLFGYAGDYENRNGQTSVRDNRAVANPYDLIVENKIESYKEIYDGPFYNIIKFDGENHVSISDMGDFGDGDIALFHAEDETGAYLDWLFPSMKTLGGHGESKTLDRLVHHAKDTKASTIKNLLRNRAENLRDWEANREAYMSRLWCVLYSDRELMGECSGVHHDADGDHVYVEVDFSGHEENEYHELIVRLPECEIVEVFALDNPKEYDVNSLKTESVGEVLQRLALATDTIFEIARKQAEPDVTEDDMNALRDKIDGKIWRSMPIACPYCHKSFMGEHVQYVVHIPVKFYMHSGNFGVFEDEVYQSVTEAVEAGKVEGVCEFCGHTVTAEDINKVKDGWKYRWRYDPHN